MKARFDTAFVSALGAMGRRHVKGLVRAGFSVVAVDPNPAVLDVTRRELQDAGLDSGKLSMVDRPTGKFGVAVFAETTPDRLANFTSFLNAASASRIFLEKPLSADPAEYDRFLDVARGRGVENVTQVNFIRRTWPHVQYLAHMCLREKEFTMTLNGGAIGLGCMGIHYLDTFLCLSGDELPAVLWASLSAETVKSGRGPQFEDFGGDFVLVGPRGRLLASLSAESSANVLMTVRGEHFMAQVDYNEMKWKISHRKADSTMPFYRYGADYEIVEQGRLELPAMDAVTEDWALGRIDLPVLEHALVTHRLLDEILQSGGAHPPYRFT
jgi:predicted dehydrogenase